MTETPERDASATPSAITLHRPWLLGFGRALARPLLRAAWKIEVHGAQHVPATGRVILAANHLAGLDGPLVQAFAPRQSRFLSKKELFRGILGTLLRWCGQIEVDRTQGRTALAAALMALQQETPVGIFPEGNRGRGEVSSIRAGVAWLAVHGEAPIVPVACLGTRATGRGKSSVPGFRSRIVVAFGAPMPYVREPGVSTREAVGQTAERVRTALAAHVSASAQRYGIHLPDDDATAPPATH